MKFRALMQDAQCMREFYNITLTLSKLSKDCVMNISANGVCFLANEEYGTLAPLVWVDIDASKFFQEYTMHGMSEDNPQIVLSMASMNMGRAMAGIRHNARYIRMKLVHMQFPCLNIEAEVLTPHSDEPRQVTHSVPVDVIAPCDWSAYTAPTLPICQLTLNIPLNRMMRGNLDKFKNLSPNITFYLTSEGEMNLVAETEMATITTRYKNLALRNLNTDSDRAVKEKFEASCVIDAKKIALFFAALQVSTTEMSLGIDNERLMHLEINVCEGVVIHSTLPTVCMDIS